MIKVDQDQSFSELTRIERRQQRQQNILDIQYQQIDGLSGMDQQLVQRITQLEQRIAEQDERIREMLQRLVLEE